MSETTPLTYSVDSAHSSIRFWVRHLMISKVHGTITGITGAVTGSADAPHLATFEISIPLSTFSTSNESRDGHVKSADFLDIEKFPTMTYKSKSLTKTGANTYDVLGDLTLHGVTHEVPLKAEASDEIASPFGGFKVGVNATGVVNREDFGVSYNQALETGGVMLGKEIHIEIDLELDRPA
jgi:polyisoprenoid-binding protein YceI